MKAKANVKDNKRDIDIDITIENNLMSKNTYDTKKKKKHSQDKSEPTVAAEPAYNNWNMPREVAEYYGIMASKKMHDLLVRDQPRDLNQYLPPISLYTAPAPQMTPVPTTTPAPQMTPVPTTPPATGTPSVPPPLNVPNPTWGAGAGSAASANPAISTLVPNSPGQNQIEELIEPVFLPGTNPENIPQPVVEYGLDMLEGESEMEFVSMLDPASIAMRNKFIEMILRVDKYPTYKPQMRTIKNWKLGKYIKANRQILWRRIKEGTY